MTRTNTSGEQGAEPPVEPGRDATQVAREVTAMVLLAATAVIVFLATRQLAAWERRVNVSDAAAWYARGSELLDAGRSEAAVVALRRAHNKNPGNRTFAISLAHALSASGRADDAERVLVSLREPSPEDPGINLELARLAAARDDAAGAVRYFHSALYGVWPEGRDEDQRAARIELVRFLLRHKDRTTAVAELVALTANLPDTVADHTEAGQLMLAADEPQRALDQFRRGLARAPADLKALSGAGESSFLLGDYAGALRYLVKVANLSPELNELRELATEVLDRDPLAAKLPLSERRRRLLGMFEAQIERIEGCRTRAEGLSSASSDRLDAAQRDLALLETRLRKQSGGDAGDLIETAFDTVIRVQQTAAEMCGDADRKDKALVLIGRAHEGRS